MTPMSAPTAFVSPAPAAQGQGGASIRRPKILIRAAQAGLPLWRRERDLPRLLGTAVIPGPAAVMTLLVAEEAWLDAARRAGDGAWTAERHVGVLIALLAELRAARAVQAPPDRAGNVIPFTARGTARPARP